MLLEWKYGAFENANIYRLIEKEDYFYAIVFSYKSAKKLPRKREILIVQVEFGEIISIERVE
jgi:hypothetical protein